MSRTGNLTLAFSADRGSSYTDRYDYPNRLEAVDDDSDTTRKAALTYDALGRRVLDHTGRREGQAVGALIGAF